MEYPLNEPTEKVFTTAFRVHKHSGVRVRSMVFLKYQFYTLGNSGFSFDRKIPIQAVFDVKQPECCYRINLLSTDEIGAEWKSHEKHSPVNTTLGLSNIKLGIHKAEVLQNYNDTLSKRGIKSILN